MFSIYGFLCCVGLLLLIVVAWFNVLLTLFRYLQLFWGFCVIRFGCFVVIVFVDFFVLVWVFYFNSIVYFVWFDFLSLLLGLLCYLV